MKLVRKVSLISDTHGLLRPEAREALLDADMILHAGDLGTPEIMAELQAIAPTFFVRGNVDRGSWAESVPMTAAVEINGKWIYMIHILEDLDLDPAGAGMDFILFGHSHKPEIYTKDGVMFINPGSAGRRRFSLPVTMGEMIWNGSDFEVRWFDLLETNKNGNK